MEIKKNPKKDVHRMSGMFFQIGLGISIAIVITAFEWRTEIKKVAVRTDDIGTEMLPVIPLTDPPEPKPTLPSPFKNEPTSSNSISLVPFTIELTDGPDPEATPTIDPSLGNGDNNIIVDDPEPCVDCIEVFPETQAQPKGGYEAFYQELKNNLKYPRRAASQNIEGKVFVEFVVTRDGTPVNFKVIRGIGFGCDEEAMRVIGLSKWVPGKQRGRPVRVKMIMPIVFKLN